MQYETPIWTLIGVILGFLLSFVMTRILDWRSQGKQFKTTNVKIISYIRDNNVPVAIKAISEIEAIFKESDQLKILSGASLESSLNASNNKITEYIFEKLEWMMINYGIYFDGSWNFKELGLKTKKEKIKINKIHSIIWTVLRDVVEYHQSEKIIERGYHLIEILDKFALAIKHYELLFASIRLFFDVGTKSIGIEYMTSFKILNFQQGIILSLKYLQRIKNITSEYCEDNNLKGKLFNTIEVYMNSIINLERKKIGNLDLNP